jgi:hypothetical protein
VIRHVAGNLTVETDIVISVAAQQVIDWTTRIVRVEPGRELTGLDVSGTPPVDPPRQGHLQDRTPGPPLLAIDRGTFNPNSPMETSFGHQDQGRHGRRGSSLKAWVENLTKPPDQEGTSPRGYGYEECAVAVPCQDDPTEWEYSTSDRAHFLCRLSGAATVGALARDSGVQVLAATRVSTTTST